METLEDVVREMRDFENVAEDGYDQYEAYQMLCWFANRIEKAYNYALVEKYNGVVNEREKEIESLRDDNERLKQFDQEKDRLIEKLKSHLSTAINALAPKCVDCADVCDMCDCRHSAWIPFAKLLIAGGDYDESDYESLPLVSMTVNRTEIENLKDENARIHAALQPVLDAKTHASDQQEHEDMPYYKVLVKCHNAVRKAQEIYKQGEKSDE